MKKYNFSAGPSILENEVIKNASKSVLELDNSGLSLLEISHRGDSFVEIIEESKSLTKKLLGISDTHEILFLQGGASLQFYMSALNFFNEYGGGYIDTGTWSSKAIVEAKKIGNTHVVASSSDKNYNYIPKGFKIDNDLDYIHITSNNTIFGTQFQDFYEIKRFSKKTKVICDMSSDIFSRNFDVNDFDLIYAGAQKNLGPAGTTLIIIKKNSITPKKNLPSYLDYKNHIDKKSMFNTPPVFSIYVSLLTLKWLDKIGGISVIEAKNKEKAKLLYGEIDRNHLFEGYSVKTDRSMMNVTFSINNLKMQNKFNEMCNKNGIVGIKGHRSVGGYRASIYNAMNLKSVEVLVEIMKELEKKV